MHILTKSFSHELISQMDKNTDVYEGFSISNPILTNIQHYGELQSIGNNFFFLGEDSHQTRLKALFVKKFMEQFIDLEDKTSVIEEYKR